MVEVCSQMKTILAQNIRYIDELSFVLCSKMECSIFAKCPRHKISPSSIHIFSCPSHQMEIGIDCIMFAMYNLKKSTAGR